MMDNIEFPVMYFQVEQDDGEIAFLVADCRFRLICETGSSAVAEEIASGMNYSYDKGIYNDSRLLPLPELTIHSDKFQLPRTAEIRELKAKLDTAEKTIASLRNILRGLATNMGIQPKSLLDFYQQAIASIKSRHKFDWLCIQRQIQPLATALNLDVKQFNNLPDFVNKFLDIILKIRKYEHPAMRYDEGIYILSRDKNPEIKRLYTLEQWTELKDSEKLR